MDADQILLTILSHPAEPQADFSSRLSQFWTSLLRDHPNAFELVYAEAIAFEAADGRLNRRYLAHIDVADLLEERLRDQGLAHEAIDRDDLYTKYEATPSEWMQIEH
jgi:hypothetical protein